uniref:Uncharacterized protein n=1 Tax=Oryza brachyantha TaxID=4533 RepID=J3M047_ORYBR
MQRRTEKTNEQRTREILCCDPAATFSFFSSLICTEYITQTWANKYAWKSSHLARAIPRCAYCSSSDNRKTEITV